MFWKGKERKEPEIETIKTIFNRFSVIEAEIVRLQAQTDANRDQIATLKGKVYRERHLEKQNDLVETQDLNIPVFSPFKR